MDHTDIDKQVFELLSKARPVDDDKERVIRIALNILVVFVLAASAFAAYSLFTLPQGKITSPAPDTLTPQVIAVNGFTKNIPLERRHIWLTVDVKKVGLCWPKMQIYKPNEPFAIKIYEGGPNKEFVVCLYAVDQRYHNDILKWVEDVKHTGIREGFPIIPESFKLDDVRLTLR